MYSCAATEWKKCSTFAYTSDSPLIARFAASRDGGVLVEGRTVYVFVDAATMRKQEIPDWVRDGLAPYVVA